ncbi:MAG: hypothetical protein WAW80_01735 [Candidatus Saccharimonadales bacterium]
MLLSGSELIDMPVMGLQTGKELARTSEAIINPHNLSIIAYGVVGAHLDHTPSFIRTVDIRELGNLGIIIDSSDEFVEPDDIIVDKAVYDLNFEIVGKHVIDDKKAKIGKVIGYTIEVDSFVIQQLSVKRPILKSFNEDELLVNRGQIIEVTDTMIIIKSGKVKNVAKVKPSRHFVNPFRQTTPQPETAKTNNQS